jgi:hypothetical protein
MNKKALCNGTMHFQADLIWPQGLFRAMDLYLYTVKTKKPDYILSEP